MSIYDEQGRRREGRMDVDDMVRPTYSGFGGFGILLVIALAFIAWFSYGRVSPTVDTTKPSLTAPVTGTPTPTAKPEQPATQPNP